MTTEYPDPEACELTQTAASQATTARGTKRSYEKRESKSPGDEDILQTSKRVTNFSTMQRASDLPWATDVAGGPADNAAAEIASSDSIDEPGDEEDSPLPLSPMPPDNTHLWMIHNELGGEYVDTGSGVVGLYRPFRDALVAAAAEIGQYGYGEDEEAEDGMHFHGPGDLFKLAKKTTKGYTWHFEGKEDWMTVDMERREVN